MDERSVTRRRAIGAGCAAVAVGAGVLGVLGGGGSEPSSADGRTVPSNSSASPSNPSTSADAGSGEPGREERTASSPTLERIGHTLLTPGGGTSEVMVRADGRYGVVGTKWGATGSYLVDLADPRNPTVLHHLEEDADCYDTKFDHRQGLYYRTGAGVQVVDYGYSEEASPSDPRVLDTIDDWAHNVYAHTEAPVLYTVNYAAETDGFDVWDTADPTDVRKVRTVGPPGNCHDLVVEADRDRLHVAWQTPHGVDGFGGYVMYDIADPLNPTEIGRFDYHERTAYSNAAVGEEAFGYGHHADFDPRRDVVIVGDERLWGTPGGKHVLDVSDPSEIEARGFTVSPNAESMDRDEGKSVKYDWTGHHFDFVPWGESTYIVSGDWHDGVVLYDVTDPDEIRAVDRYVTDDVSVSPNPELAEYGDAPMTWNAAYDDANDRVVANDMFTGLYVFDLVG